MENMTFTEDNKAVLIKKLYDLQAATGYLYKLVEQGKLTPDMAKNIPSLIEGHFIDVAELVDYNSHVTEENEKRYEKLKIANQTIFAMQEKMAHMKPIDGLSEQLKQLCIDVQKWWKKDGFSHIKEQSFNDYGRLHVNFYFMLEHRHFRITSASPLSDERDAAAHIQHLREQGFEFADFERGDGEKLKLIFNQNNMALLTDMLKKRFPSIEVTSWGNESSYAKEDVFVIKDIKTVIHDLSDI